MGRLAGLWLLVAGCSGSSDSGLRFAPIDPADPLIGRWSSAGATWLFSFPDGSSRLSFGQDGTYRSEQPRIALTTIDTDVEEGRWERIDDATIRRCVSPCLEAFESSVRIEGDAMLIDGELAANGDWSFRGAGACMAHGTWHGTTLQVTLHADGTAVQDAHVCSSLTGFPGTERCQGTWTESASSIEATFAPGWSCRPLRCYRIGDMAECFVYRRVAS